MTARLVAMWPKPDDVEGFEAHYFETHMPIARRLPGIARDRITRVGSVLEGGETPHIVTVLEWDDAAAMQAALGSDVGSETLADLDTVEERFGIRPDIVLGESAE